jgi:hypothetical protein
MCAIVGEAQSGDRAGDGGARVYLDDGLASRIAQEYSDPPYDLGPLVARLAHCQTVLDAYELDPITAHWFTPEPRVLRDGQR